MTIRQLYVFIGIESIFMVVVALVTRATARRIAGAMAGGGAMGVAALGLAALGERLGLWHMVIPWEPYFLTVALIDCAVSGCVFLITWRIARRFGARGLAVAAIVAAVVGPIRDYALMQRFPEWGAYAPGVAPILATSVAYVLLGTVGHATMRLFSGPARDDRLARRPWEPA
jgi:hypothetical protein